LTTATLVSSWWRASINMRIVIKITPRARRGLEQLGEPAARALENGRRRGRSGAGPQCPG
jgi:hypothetical protein